MTNKKLNIDIARLIASFMIVAIHVYPFSSINNNLDYTITRVLFRIAVPFFLIITGYYIISKSLNDINILKNYTKKILKLYLISILIFLPINIYNHYFIKNNILSIIKDIFINGTFYHLWYFPALIQGIWITYILIKNFNKRKTQIIISILFIIGLFGDSYYRLITTIPFLKHIYNYIFSITTYTRNGLFYTPIFLYIGYIFQTKTNKISYQNNIILIFISSIFLIIEGLSLYYFKIPKHNSMYISLIPLTFLIFNFLLFNYQGSNKKLRTYSTWIYILHPLYIIIVRIISKILNLNILITNSILNYITILILTITTIYITSKIKTKLSKKLFFPK